MSLLLHRTGRGRERRIIARLGAYDQSQRLALPRNADEIGALLGCDRPVWFWSGKDSNLGYFSGNSTVKYIKNTGFSSGADTIKSIDSNSTLPSSITNKSGVSFAFVLVCRVVGDNSQYPGYLSTTTGSMVRVAAYYSSSRFGFYSTTSEGPSSAVLGNEYNSHGGLSFCIGGWDARSLKPWGVFSGAKTEGSSSVTFDWASSGAMSIIKGIAGSFQVLQLAKFEGSAAEYLADNSVSSQGKIDLMCRRASLLQSDGSAVLHKSANDKYVVSGHGMIDSDERGCLIYPAMTNLLTESYLSSMWSGDGVSLGSWFEFDSCDIRSLSRIAETATTAEHKATATVTPLETGKHWLECSVRMLSIGGIAIDVNNGVKLGATSLDSTGQETSYSGDGSAQIVALGSGLFRVKLPINPASLAACTITVRGLALVGEAYEDTYLGSTSRVAYVGQWSLVRSSAPPLAIPVSLGSAATAIAPIVDWTDAKALNRLKHGRLTADVVISVDEWPEADVCLWSWREDANNGVEVWLRYEGTMGGCRTFSLAVVLLDGGASSETAMTSGIWVLYRDASTFVEQLRVNVSIDSAGLVKWWARSDSGEEISLYETDIYTSGEDTIASYSAPVPTSIRLGSDCDGTGQQAMIIKEVSIW